MLKVLIVEDNPDLLDILRELLAEEFEVETATDGDRGVQLARDFQPDVVIMDLQLPRMNGLEAGRHIKNDRAPEDVPVIALTALAQDDLSDAVLESGCCDAFINKPASLDRIRDVVRDLLTEPGAEA